LDLQERHQLDLANQVARRVRARARPWRAIIALILAVAAAMASSSAGGLFEHWTSPGHVVTKIVAAAAAAAFCLFAAVAVIELSRKAREVLTPLTGASHAAVVGYAIALVGVITLLLIALSLLKVPVGQLIVGGALTTILIGIAGQQWLSNVFAGIVLLISRPFNVGDAILLRSGPLSGQIEGTVTEIGITYLRLDTGSGILCLPNAQVLSAGVTRLRPPATEPGGAEQLPTAPPVPSAEGLSGDSPRNG
jgi:small-conductance mechanosensitive channel